LEKEIILSTGKKIVLREPEAGMRNKALVIAETPEGIKQSTFMIELLPLCIKSHDLGPVNIKDALDKMSIKDYDALTIELSELMKPEENLKKNSLEP